MQWLPGRLLPTGIGTAVLVAGSLALPACTSDGYVSRSYSSDTRYRVQGRYYHCHRNRGGVCHNVRHPDYYWRGGSYRPRYQQARPLPARPRPL
ncbi:MULTISPECIES: hypothetical protein [Microbulbifer]|uniref:hypothetical protein n=1 Tax=Microbulbifer TaxID=48073 RepID=UPI001E39EBE2|nr:MULTISPECIES: hypothetical protein [Microbulbifer]UHQ53667.1 hypothetical protein LVE68_09075 [Microbulbifer sp. YPW16]